MIIPHLVVEKLLCTRQSMEHMVPGGSLGVPTTQSSVAEWMRCLGDRETQDGKFGEMPLPRKGRQKGLD